LAKKSIPVLLTPISEPNMTLSLRRIVLFGMVTFCHEVLGLKVTKDEKGWKEFDVNGCVQPM